MKKRHNCRTRGLTLVEMLIVLAIVSLLAAIAIPTFAMLGGMTRTDVQRTSNEVYNLLRAARIYASTFNVDTAVVYSLDNFKRPIEGNDIEVPRIDSVTGDHVRAIEAAALFYKLPAGHQFPGAWVPVPGEEGQFRRFPGGAVVLLQSVRDDPPAVQTVYYTDQARYQPPPGDLQFLGMTSVNVFLDGYGPFADPPEDPDPNNRNLTVAFPAHVFSPRGSLKESGPRQRIEIHIAPGPTANLTDRLHRPEMNSYIYVDENGVDRLNLMTIPIELYQATGRIKIVS